LRSSWFIIAHRRRSREREKADTRMGSNGNKLIRQNTKASAHAVNGMIQIQSVERIAMCYGIDDTKTERCL